MAKWVLMKVTCCACLWLYLAGICRTEAITTTELTESTDQTTTPAFRGKCCNDECYCQPLDNGYGLEATCTSSENVPLLTKIPICTNANIAKLAVVGHQVTEVDDELQHLVNLEHLHLSQNMISKIDQHAFENQRKLVFLDLSENSLNTGSFPKDVFAKTSLKSLNLGKNELRSISDPFLDSAPHLTTLDLSENKIGSIGDLVFQGLNNLLALNLKDNKLMNVPTQALQKVSTLYSLDFQGNPLGTLKPGDFEDIVSLSVLVLSNCSLDNSIDVADVFSGPKNLTSLELSYNNLKTIPSDALHGLSETLQNLFLDSNPIHTITRLPDQTELKYLKQLSLTKMPELVEVTEYAFSDFENVEQISLSNCPKLAKIAKSAFPPNLKKLRNLYLEENALRTLEEDLFVWSDLELLQTYGNPFHCDCDLLWFYFYLKNHPLFRSNVRCASPHDVAETEIYRLQLEDFRCDWMGSGYQFNITAVLVSFVFIVSLAAVITVVVITVYRYKIRKKQMETEIARYPLSHPLASTESQDDDNANTIAVGDNLQLVV